MELKIALAGNPNSGKTTLFNDLTGSRQYVGNWPGVTVEKKEGKLKGAEYKDVVIQDLPGIYSLSPYTLEEVVSRTYLVTEKPDAIINIVDGTNIERNLYLTTQLLELNIPMVVALNMMDLVRKNGDKIDIKALSDALGCEVVELSALKGEGTDSLIKKAVTAAKAGTVATKKQVLSGDVEAAIVKIEGVLRGSCDEKFLRWNAVKAFERDEKAVKELHLTSDQLKAVEDVVKECEKAMDDDSESIITNERYSYITSVTSAAVKKGRAKGELSVSDKIDKIVTNRILGLPIFVLVMAFIYAIAMGGWSVSIGTMATDFTNDVIFGEWVPGFFDTILTALHVEEGSVLYGLIQDGIVAGVGAFIGFVVQIGGLCLLLSIVEGI